MIITDLISTVISRSANDAVARPKAVMLFNINTPLYMYNI